LPRNRFPPITHPGKRFAIGFEGLIGSCCCILRVSTAQQTLLRMWEVSCSVGFRRRLGNNVEQLREVCFAMISPSRQGSTAHPGYFTQRLSLTDEVAQLAPVAYADAMHTRNPATAYLDQIFFRPHLPPTGSLRYTTSLRCRIGVRSVDEDSGGLDESCSSSVSCLPHDNILTVIAGCMDG
jgi:hypothetical protein